MLFDSAGSSSPNVCKPIHLAMLHHHLWQQTALTEVTHTRCMAQHCIEQDNNMSKDVGGMLTCGVQSHSAESGAIAA